MFNLKRFPDHHLPIANLQLSLKVNEATSVLVCAYGDRRYTLTGYLTPSTHNNSGFS